MPYLIYFIAINIFASLVCIFDKRRAKTNGWRVRESTLFTICFLGGGLGMLLTMKTIRHKTKHKRFMIGIPLIILLQIAVILVLQQLNLIVTLSGVRMTAVAGF